VGTTFDPASLAPGPYAVTVGYDQGGCVDTKILTVTVSDPAATFTATNATCANNDGSILINTVTGGVAPYSYIFNGTPLASLPPGNVFSGLSAANHTFSVIDNVGCRRDYTIPITFPGAISFTQVATNPDCNGNGGNGAIDVTLVSVGTFNVGVTTDPVNDPTFQTVSSTGATLVSFPALTAATYYLHVRSTGTECPSKQTIILAGPVPVTFTAAAVDIVCLGSSGGVDFTGITGAPAVDFTYMILQGATVIKQGTIASAASSGTVSISGPEIIPGTFDVTLTQDQSVASGCPGPIGPAAQTVTINGPSGVLDTLYTIKSISFPEAPTGSLTVGVAESGQEPYEIRVELIAPVIPGQSFLQDYTVVSRNAASVMEYTAGNLYAGTYEVRLRDALGCEKIYSVDIAMETGLLVPNIFTPNNDGFNDVFYIRNLPPGSSLVITNRWGKEVYSAKDYQNDWDAGDTSDGIYYFKLDMPAQSMTGWLEIARGNK
jgi:gliding motility-associated-like protein